ncbi:peptidylprolyl isomerase [Pseudoteredinibacter isoporae]|uniref:PpiC domain-containing protein n=1 Tax=Pseudoteredinibacter isoporae TaxID=570281 RepID=A0A7X0JRC6_9GAMM|nr:peptidylprolyl isomerase [Pseudoteredinibacter isoporae]MBB6520873.1 hypothetical protein [Pseudoteredinibacter isoporae]NHO86438.1 peptidyl-prolyl cis-trans isomerase [Pseudoteredinibacter isoporae]NIB25110.1 peptidyl-prolyl cis-trans isomerase [Pseudoteredinibacter isoporae]
MRLFKEPLLYFLLAGFGLFVLYYSINPEEDDQTIVVDENSLLTFIQYRSKAFSPELAKKRWDAMSELERKQLLRDYYEEELLFREADGLGLMEDDYIIKRRLVQKMDFILQSSSAEPAKPKAEDLRTFMDANAEDYKVQPFASFTHVFLPASDSSQAAAEKVLQELNTKSVPFSDAGRYGERFLYHRNYVERTRDYVAAHFGEPFAETLFNWPESELDGQAWIGPIASDHGQHLLLVKQRKAAYQPTLEEVLGRVEQDYLRKQQEEQKQAAVKALSSKYPPKGDATLIDMLQGE